MVLSSAGWNFLEHLRRMTDDPKERESAQSASGRPGLSAVVAPEGIELKDPLFLPTLLPCCSQLALPYMAKVIGMIGNHLADEVMVKVTVALLDGAENTIGEGSDVVAVESREWAKFEIKIVEMNEQVKRYRITAERTDESDPWFS